MEIKNNLLYGNDGTRIPYKQSPNHGGIITPTYGVIHYDAAPNDTSAINWMTNPASKVSAHLHISRSGKVTQLLPFNVCGYHAGKSTWNGLIGLNSHSIGIELQNSGNEVYTDIQMKALADVCNTLNKYYPIKEWVGHSDISPGRKIDPGKQFPWKSFREAMYDREFKTTSGLNLRDGGSTEHKVILVIPKGESVRELSRSGDWSKVVYNGTEGYISNKYLTR